MAKKITRKDIFSEENIFKGVIASANDMIKKLNAVDATLKKTAQGMKSAFNVKLNSTQAIKEFTKAVEKANSLNVQAQKVAQARQKAEEALAKAEKALAQAEKERAKATEANLKTQKEKVRLAQEEEKLAQQKIKTEKAQSQESARLAKEEAKRQKIAQDNASAYKQLERSTRDLKNQSKELGAQLLKLEVDGKKNTSAYRQLEQQYKKVTAEAQKGDAQLKKLDKTVGDNFRNVGNYESALGKLSNAFGLFGIAFGAGAITQFATKAVVDYEVQNSKLAGVLGTVTANTKNLQAVQRELGRTTAYTAGDVARLQVELAKLGFTNVEIENASNGILKLAGATGSDLARASEVAGSTLRGFGLDAVQMTHVTDVMAKSFSTSALDMESFAESMKYVAPIAKLAGFSIEETSAYLGVLANQGVKGSQAGTSLRRIFTDMARTGKPAKEALAEVTKNGIQVTDAFDEVGRTAMTALSIIGNNTDKVDELAQTYRLADGAVNQMYNTMTDNLQGGVDRLSSAWESYILDVNNSTGASKNLQHALDWLAENLVSILDVVSFLVELWIKYKIITLAQIGYNKLLASSFVQTATSVGGFKGALSGLGGVLRNIGSAIAQNAVGLATFVGVNMFLQFKKINDIAGRYDDTLKEVKTQTDDLTNSTKQQKDRVNLLFGELKKGNLTYEQKQKILEKINAEYGLTLQNLKDEKEFTKQVTQAQTDLIKKLDEKLAYTVAEAKYRTLSTRYTEITGEMDVIDATLEQMSMGEEIVGNLFRFFGATSSAQLTDEYNALGAVQAKLRVDLNKAEAEYKKLFKKIELDSALTDVGDVGGGGGGTGGGTTSAPNVSEYEAEIIVLDKYDAKIRELAQSLKLLNEEFSKDTLIQDIDVEISAKVKYSEEQLRKGLDPFADIVEGEQYDEVERNIIKRFDLLREIDKQNTEFNKETLRINYKKQYEDELKSIEDSFKEANETYQKERADLQKAIAKGEESPVSLVNLDKAFKGTTDSYNKAKDQLAENEKTRQIDLNKEIEIEEANHKKRLGELDKEQNDKINEYNEKRLQKVEEVNAEIIQNNKETNEKLKNDNAKELEKYRERWENIANVVKEVTEFFIELSNRRIEKIDEEIARAKENYETYKELAKAGNINAQQSLEEQNKIIAQATKKREAEERRQARLKLINTAFETYSNNVSKLKENEPTSKALTKTITDITLLSKIVQNLPIFEKGTEDTGVNGRGVDGKGGFHAILHPRERVLTKEQNAPLIKAGISNEELSRIATDYKAGKLLTIAPVETNTDLGLLVNKIEDLTKVIENKPEVNVGVGEITQSLVEIVQKEKRANTVTYNRYRVKK
jgi:DNA repair exonuclease SbcCD ATPase subunit